MDAQLSLEFPLLAIGEEGYLGVLTHRRIGGRIRAQTTGDIPLLAIGRDVPTPLVTLLHLRSNKYPGNGGIATFGARG